MTAQPDHGPESWLPRLREVRETGDRRATGALLRLLLHGTALGPLDDETRDDVADALCVLEDPRCEERLVAVLLDTACPRGLRGAALRILSCLPSDDPPTLRVAAWLDDRDGLVRAFAASFLGACDAERVARLAHDPVVEVRRAVAEALVGASRTPELVGAVRRLLGDEDAIVRETACRAALFDEPLALTYDLLHLLDDADEDVRCGVYDALEDYPCVSVLLALADARGGPDGALAAATLEMLVARVEGALAAADEDGLRRLRRWIAPARWLLDESRDLGPRSVASDGLEGAVATEGAAGSPGDPGEARAPRRPVDVPQAGRILTDPDAPSTAQRELLVSRDWSAAGVPGLAVLVETAASRLWSLRHGVAVALLDLVRGGVAGAAEALLALTEDVEPVVRRVAIHALTHAADPRVVPSALVTLADDRARAMAGDAALQAVAHLASAEVAERAVLAELRVADDRDGLVLGAVHLAERLRIAAAAPLLAVWGGAEIAAGPGVHVASLRTLRTLGARPVPRLDHLESVDHLDVQVELAAWDWHGPRYG
jgi:HEAT repeat protein